MTDQSRPAGADDDLEVQVLRLATGYRRSQVVAALADLRIPDALAAGPMTVADLATVTGANGDGLRRFLRACVALELLAEPEPGRFGQTELSALLRADGPGSLRSFVLAMTAPGHWLPWGRLADAVRSGEPVAEAALGSDIWTHFERNPGEARHFADAMGWVTAGVASELVRVLDLSSARLVVDVGGSRGVLLGEVLAAAPGARGILFDLPEVTAGADLPADVSSRVEVRSGSFLDAVPEAGDLYLLKHILHDWDDERCRVILRNCRDAMAPHGRVAAVEIVLPPEAVPAPAAMLDLNMLVLLSGRERTAAEYRALFTSAGLDVTGILETETQFSVLVGERTGGS